MKYTTTVDAIQWTGDLNAIDDFVKQVSSGHVVYLHGTNLLVEKLDDYFYYISIPENDWLVFAGEFRHVSDDVFKKNYK